MNMCSLAFDAASVRSVDANGFLHVASSHITKATVNPYYGREIPGWQEAGLDPERIYYGFRAPEELRRSLPTWEGLPLHIEHHIDSADEPRKLTRVGAVGKAVWNAPYVDAPLTVWDRAVIDAIEDDSFRELSCAYRYDPDFTPGRYEGIEYDFIMRNIRGNHVALVEEGRAGPDVVVADAALWGAQDDRWITVKPNGAQNKGRPALIDENGTIKAGMGGKFNGRSIDDIPRGKNPHPVTEEKYQARQKRQAAKGEKGGSTGQEETSSVKSNEKGRPVAPKRPEGIPDGYWNGKFYSGNRIFVDNKQVNLTDTQVKELKQWQSDYAEYKKARQADTQAAPKSYLNVRYEDRQKAKEAGAQWDPAAKKWYWDNRNGELPESLNKYSEAVSRQDNPTLRRKAKEYDNTFNEGGEGFNPYRAEMERRAFSTGRREVATATLNTKSPQAVANIPGASAFLEAARSGDRSKADAVLESNPELRTYLAWANNTSPTSTGFAKQRAAQAMEEGKSFAEAKKMVDEAIRGTWDADLAQDADDPRNYAGFVTRQPNLIKGAVMRVKNWFRGARDADPGIERQEVDLAQAIIDLHKVDPETGEIVDITEDEDKAAEIRKLIGELSSRLDPAEVKRLTDALSDLAYSKATGDAEPNKRSFAEGVNYGEKLERNPVERRKLDREHESEGMKRAMDACGLDADDEDASKAFAEGVKYGEGLLRNPAKREKLDREHESEGMKRAMDACGLDAENPQESRAFAEGVKYGEKLEKKEPEKLDREHESEGMKKALGKDEDKNAAIERILAGVPGLTPEQEAKLRSSLADLAYSPATGDADPDADPSAAQDRALRKPSGPRPLLASDAALIQARAVAAAQDNMRAIARAVADVRPLVGELDLLAFDSAANVYGYALEQSGVDARLYPRDAWRGMVDVLRSQKSPSGRRLAQDAAPRKLDGQFAGLNTISIGD